MSIQKVKFYNVSVDVTSIQRKRINQQIVKARQLVFPEITCASVKRTKTDGLRQQSYNGKTNYSKEQINFDSSR